MLTGWPLIIAVAVPFTKLLMNGAFGFWKICWIEPENWFAGCVQLWFSMAITKTVLICWAAALKWPTVIDKASTASARRCRTSDILSSRRHNRQRRASHDRGCSRRAHED